MKDALSSNLVLSRGSTGRVGSDRIALVEAVARDGSITRAAKALGLSYRAAWDAVQAVNNLFDEPLIAASVGGASGGAAEVTPRGRQVIAAYRRIETELGEIWSRLGDEGLPAADIWSLGMKTSARNALRGVVEAINGDTVNAEVVLSMGGGVIITAVVTETSVKALGLAVGSPAIALIKSSFVILAPDGPPMKTSARNLLRGRIVSRTDGGVSSEVVLELAEGKTLAATLTRDSADALGFKAGDMAWALIKAPHVILAVE